MSRVALIILDFQADFEKDLPPSILDAILGLMEEANVVIATQSIHLSGSHCVKGTKGARLNPEIKEEADYIATKGDDPAKGDFSGFQARTLRPLRTMEEILKDEKIDTVWVVGLGHVWDVPQTAFDANALGYPTSIWQEGTPGLISDYTLRRLQNAGVKIR